ncbi:glycerate kinase type-2 family protein [Paraliomyxa miuraensis]|uniref:glycerate kinase type-2 family protein n=1 Tax=Paraliomyxa miuraensis TaxID=376150 RepID=UPI002250DD52|nr:DUF4147 domain-containing protein [Paraliomyxa miuraensis]MCX4242988.1 DUF4147 domain-containing protein [Paraliomyxa miuraensis]
MVRLQDLDPLRRRPEGPALGRVLSAALEAVDPSRLIEQTVDATTHDALRLGEHVLPLAPAHGVWIVAVGKAAPSMAAALSRRIPPSRLRGGVVVAKHALAEPEPGPAPLPLVLGAHPIPDARSEAAGRAVLDVLARAGPGDVVVVALSGGASSLMVAPAPGLALDELRTVGEALLSRGVPIEEINTVRKALDELKGGGLLAHASHARVATLLLSDVVDAPLHVVGSGPTLPDPTGPSHARAVLARYAIEVPPTVRACLARAPDPSPHPIVTGPVIELASNATATHAAIAAARAEGWHVEPLPTLRGEARDQGRTLAARLRALDPPLPTILIAGGETTVTVRGPGRGGRNQELALAAMLELDGPLGTTLVTLATDGEDGPTDAAGAVVDGASAARARSLGLDPTRHLHANDAHPVFDALGDLLRIGPTGTNVCDLVLALNRPDRS